MPKLASVIEAILYLKGRPLPINRLAEYAGCDREMAEEGLMELMNDYAHRESALEIIETQDGYCLQLKSGFRHLVDTLIPLDLGVGALRTLAAIALRGPIVQTDLVDLRGSGAYQHVHDLVKLGFVRRRRQADGRSFIVQVTDKFHQNFEIDQLPQIMPKVKSPATPQSAPTDEAVSNDAIAPDAPLHNGVSAEPAIAPPTSEEIAP
ncbi:MAG: SMC-Scp complex subunit ScpB [Cyanobacteria bacterium P01_H01_bin.58]